MSSNKKKKATQAEGSKGGVCSNCNKSTSEAGSRKYCGRCRKAAYCSEECQKQHWKSGGHKQECVAPAEKSSNSKNKTSRVKEGNMSMAEAMAMARSGLRKIYDKAVAGGFVKSLMRQNRLNKLFVSGMDQTAAVKKAFRDDPKHEDRAHELGKGVADFVHGDADSLPKEVIALIRETETLHHQTAFAAEAGERASAFACCFSANPVQHFVCF